MEEKDTTYSSIWLFRKKRTMWKGTDPIANIKNYQNIRGKNFSEFNPTVAENIINFWSEKDDLILDPFAGRTRGIISASKNRKYIGFEISSNVCQKIKPILNQKRLFDFAYPPKIINDDAFNVQKYKVPKADFIFTCPPYWKIEKYDSCEGQLSDIKKYPLFLERFKQIMKNFVNLLKEDKYAAIVVGDFRIKKKYYTLHCDTIRIMEELGMKLHDIVLLQSVTFDIANRRFGMFKKWKFTSKVHEYLLIFKKEKPREIEDKLNSGKQGKR